MRNRRKSLIELYSSRRVSVTREGGLQVSLAGKRTVRVPKEYSGTTEKVRAFMTQNRYMTQQEADEFCPSDRQTETALRFIVGLGPAQLRASTDTAQSSATA